MRNRFGSLVLARSGDRGEYGDGPGRSDHAVGPPRELGPRGGARGVGRRRFAFENPGSVYAATASVRKLTLGGVDAGAEFHLAEGATIDASRYVFVQHGTTGALRLEGGVLHGTSTIVGRFAAGPGGGGRIVQTGGERQTGRMDLGVGGIPTRGGYELGAGLLETRTTDVSLFSRAGRSVASSWRSGFDGAGRMEPTALGAGGSP